MYMVKARLFAQAEATLQAGIDTAKANASPETREADNEVLCPLLSDLAVRGDAG